MTARTKPPFRADHVGSILRSAAIKDARASHAAGKLGDAGLKTDDDCETMGRRVNVRKTE